MEEIPGIIFLGKSVEKLKAFTITYLVLISAILANILLDQTHDFYDDKNVDLTFSDVIGFMLSPQGALFMIGWAAIVAFQFLLAPVLISAMTYITRFFFAAGGNLFFLLIYIVLIKIFRLKAEKKFALVGERELLNYLLYLLGVCYYSRGKIFRSKKFEYYKWYVTGIVDPCSKTAADVCLITAMLISTWIVVHQYAFFEGAPVVYVIVTCITLCAIANAIVVSWIVSRSDYFLSMVTNAIDPISEQRDPEKRLLF